jgi:C-terminal processing protease CtpA/Prc
MIRQYTPEDDQPEDSEHFSISDFGMRFHASDTFEVVVSSVVPGSPAEHAGEVLQHLCET